MDARHYFESEELRDGSEVIVRAIEPDDKRNLQEGLARLSTDSVYMRFFRVIRKLSQRDLEYFTDLDFVNHVALGVALVTDEDSLPIAVGRYVVQDPAGDPGTAEVAIVVDDQFQGIGVGSMLLRHLIVVARTSGIARFKAYLLASNTRMFRILTRTGLRMQHHTEDGLTEVTLSLASSPGEA